MGRQKKTRVEADGAGFGGSLGDLLRARGLDVPSPSATPEAPAAPAPAAGFSVDDLSSLSKLVVRRTRKGRGGRTATLVEGLEALAPADREALAGALRKALGTGAKVEGEVVAVQGDVGPRLSDWLQARGVRRVVVS